MPKLIDLTGKRFGKLVVIKISRKDNNRQYYWICQCDCGNTKEVLGNNIKRELTTSCGCIHKEMMRKNKYGLTHNMTGTVEHKAWDSMKQRCNNPNNHNYGKRGIVVCNRWLTSFENFYEDMGSKPGQKYTLERINNNGNYEPSNCKWATTLEQNRNMRSNKIKNINEANDIRKLYKKGISVKELADSYNCCIDNIKAIIENKNWKDKDIV